MFRLALGLGMVVAVFSSCAPNQCITLNGYKYRTLDGVYPHVTQRNAQVGYLPLLDGWELCMGQADCLTVASSHGWGCARIVMQDVNNRTSDQHCICTSNYKSWGTDCGPGEDCVRRWRQQIVFDGENNVTEYGCMHEDKILIRQRIDDCLTNETSDPNSPTGCSPCPTGHLSYGGAGATCLPTMAYAMSQLPVPSFRVRGTDNGILELSFEAELPNIHENVTLSYWPTVALEESMVDASFTCKDLWSATGSGNLTNLTISLNFSELNGPCQLNLSFTPDHVVRGGVAALVLVTNDDAPQAYWYFPVVAYFPRSTHAYYAGLVAGQHVVVAGTEVYTGAFQSTLLLFESSAFSTPKGQAVYTAQERAFAQLSLGAPGLQVQVDMVWLSPSSDPSQSTHNLTDSLVPEGNLSSLSQAQFSVQLKACMSCYLHVLASITNHQNRRLGRRLMAHHTLASYPLPLIVKVPPSLEISTTSAEFFGSFGSFLGSFQLTVLDPGRFVETPAVRRSVATALERFWGLASVQVQLSLVESASSASGSGRRLAEGNVLVSFEATEVATEKLAELDVVETRLSEPTYVAKAMVMMNEEIATSLPDEPAFTITEVSSFTAEVRKPSTSSTQDEVSPLWFGVTVGATAVLLLLGVVVCAYAFYKLSCKLMKDQVHHVHPESGQGFTVPKCPKTEPPTLPVRGPLAVPTRPPLQPPLPLRAAAAEARVPMFPTHCT